MPILSLNYQQPTSAVDSWRVLSQSWTYRKPHNFHKKSMSTTQKGVVYSSGYFGGFDSAPEWSPPASVPLSSKELILEFLSGYSCLVETLSVEIISLLKYIIIISFSLKGFSHLFLSVLPYTSYWSSQSSIEPLLVYPLNREPCCCTQTLLEAKFDPTILIYLEGSHHNPCSSMRDYAFIASMYQ